MQKEGGEVKEVMFDDTHIYIRFYTRNVMISIITLFQK